MHVYTKSCLYLDVCTIFTVTLDDENEKVVLDVQDIRYSRHKDVHPDDSDDAQDIGLSSEEEAEELEDDPHIRRKFQYTPAPEPTPAPAPGPAAGTSTVQVPVEALQQVQQYLGQLLGGGVPTGVLPGPQLPVPEDAPLFNVPKPKKGEKVCTICKRVFWTTDTLKRHLKVHTGEQKHTCPNEGCGRKLASKRSLETHLTTCQKEKRFFCKKKDCQKLFATKEALRAHQSTHTTLKAKDATCTGCGKGGFTREKSLKDHYRYCDGNPNRVGPFPCPVAGCRRGAKNPFRRTRNLNVHLKEEHGHDPKHV